jgi:hypothetical protein
MLSKRNTALQISLMVLALAAALFGASHGGGGYAPIAFDGTDSTNGGGPSIVKPGP